MCRKKILRKDTSNCSLLVRHPKYFLGGRGWGAHWQGQFQGNYFPDP